MNKSHSNSDLSFQTYSFEIEMVLVIYDFDDIGICTKKITTGNYIDGKNKHDQSVYIY